MRRMPARFPARTLAAFEKTKYLYIRSGDHRFIPVWVVVVSGHVLVRSWNDKPGGWYRAFLEEARGAVKMDGREIYIRAVPVRSAKLKETACEAYAAKYTSKANAKYVAGFAEEWRKALTLELLPGAEQS